MHGLSQDLERQLGELERKRDAYLKELEAATDPGAQRRFRTRIANVDDRIGTTRLALSATPDRRGKAQEWDELDAGDLQELLIVGGDPEDEGVEVEVFVGADEFDEAPTRVFRPPTAPYPTVNERFV